MGGRDPTTGIPSGAGTARDASGLGPTTHVSSVRCPNEGETYRPFPGGDVTERHDVVTDTTVVRKDGRLGLRVSAQCNCGWSDSETLLPEDGRDAQ
jgi:hypothetical protein